MTSQEELGVIKSRVESCPKTVADSMAALAFAANEDVED